MAHGFNFEGNYRMYINTNKLKVMECSQIKTAEVKDVQIGNKQVSEIEQFCYLGSKLCHCRCYKDIKCRVALARKAFLKRMFVNMTHYSQYLKIILNANLVVHVSLIF